MNITIYVSVVCILLTVFISFPAKPDELPRKLLGVERPVLMTPMRPHNLTLDQETPDKSQLAKRPPAPLQESIVPDQGSPEDKCSYQDRDIDSVSPFPSPDPVLVHTEIIFGPDGVIEAPEEQPPPYEPPKNAETNDSLHSSHLAMDTCGSSAESAHADAPQDISQDTLQATVEDGLSLTHPSKCQLILSTASAQVSQHENLPDTAMVDRKEEKKMVSEKSVVLTQNSVVIKLPHTDSAQQSSSLHREVLSTAGRKLMTVRSDPLFEHHELPNLPKSETF